VIFWARASFLCFFPKAQSAKEKAHLKATARAARDTARPRPGESTPRDGLPWASEASPGYGYF